MNKTVCVVDGGLYVNLAQRLAREFERVLYFCDVQQPFPKAGPAVIGDGIEGVERINELWKQRDVVDLWVFPDCSQADLQVELVRQGKLVWGSRFGSELELNRRKFLSVIEEVGLPSPSYDIANGLTELRALLREANDRYVKISRFRGSMETFHWVSQEVSGARLDELGVEFGGVRELIRFLVFEPIEAVIETGMDTFFAGGFPVSVVSGAECKDKSYFGSVLTRDELPVPVKGVLEQIAPVLAKYCYANFFSAEVRVTDGGEAFFTDPTCRMPCPAGAPQLELYGNLGEILLAGAQGECVEPKWTAKFVAEAMVDHLEDEEKWRAVRVPKEVEQWTKLWNYGEVDGTCVIPPLPHSCTSIGTVIGLGETPAEAVAALQEHAEAFEGQPVSVNVAAVEEALASIEEAAQDGVDVAGEKVLNVEG